VALRHYEVWTPLAACDHVEDVGATMARKLAAVRCHRSQLATFRYDRAVRGLNAFRGALGARCDYAEGFALSSHDGTDGGRGEQDPERR
jgi:LmbE family N-acetylglucosaminyl deacetylase